MLVSRRDTSIHQLFEDQVARTPDAVAVVCEGEALTYSMLNRGSNQLARHLREMGAGPEKLVTLFMPRGVEMIVGLLGTLKSGAAYVPLDTDYPTGRVAYMLERLCVDIAGDALLSDGASAAYRRSERRRDGCGEE